MRYVILLFAFISVLISGCIGTIANGCDILSGKESDHCYQFLATQFNDEKICEKIKGEDFKKYGSNPPKDKCYLIIANKTNNVNLCEKIEEGFFSYSKSECITNVARNTGNPKLCEKISAYEIGQYSKTNCINLAKSSPNYVPEKTNTSFTNATIKTNVTEKNKSNIKEVPKTEAEKNQLISSSGLTPANRSKIENRTYQILANLPQKDKIDIANSVNNMKNTVRNSQNIPEPTKFNQSTKNYSEYLSKGWNWITKTTEKVEEIGEKTGQEISKGVKIISTAGKVTETYKDIEEASESFNRVNEKIRSNTITQEQGRLLKVGYALGKATKWICSKLPIIGDAAGEVADGAFTESMKVGEKIAERTTKINKCIDDPLSDDCI